MCYPGNTEITQGYCPADVDTLGESATCSDILAKLDGLFGNVSSHESIMQTFYTTCQGNEESVTAFGCRL